MDQIASRNLEANCECCSLEGWCLSFVKSGMSGEPPLMLFSLMIKLQSPGLDVMDWSPPRRLRTNEISGIANDLSPEMSSGW
ncbi:hypothetical protein SLE2022_039300 [Rubroshorea leprosula]